MKPKRSNPLFAGFFRANTLASAVVVTLAGFAMQPSAQAGNLYWDTNAATAGSGNAAGTWDTGTNWSTDSTGASATTAWVNGESAVFSAGTDGTGGYTVTLAGTVSTPSILVEEAGAKTIAGGTINIGGGSISTAAAGTGNTFTISSILAGSGGLTVAGNGDMSDTGGGAGGMLVLSGASTFTGNVTLTAGLVRLNSSFGDAANKIILNGGGLLDNNLNLTSTRNIEVGASGGTIRLYGSATTNLNGSISNASGVLSANLKHTDGGTLRLGGSGAGYTGTFTNARGNIQLVTTNWAGMDLVNTDGATFTVVSTGDTTIKSLSSDRDVQIPAGGRLNISSGNYTAADGAGVNNFWMQGSGKVTSSSGTLTLNWPTSYETASDRSVRVIVEDFNGTTPLAVVKNGVGGVNNYDKANTYTGGTTINAGRITSANVQCYGTGAVTVNSGGQAYLTAAGTFANNFVINGSGSTETAGQLGAIRFQGNTVSGSINVASASRIVAYGSTGTHTGALTGSAALNLNLAASPGTLNFTGNTVGYTGAMTFNAGTLNIGASGLGGDLTISGRTATSTSGTVTVAGNTAAVTGGIAGNVTVNGGTASADGATAIANAGGGTLTVGGLIGGNAVVNAGSTTTLNGGTATATGGALTVNGGVTGNVTVADGASLGGESAIAGTLNLGSTTGSTLRIKADTVGALSAGTLNLAGTNTVTLDSLPSVSGPFVVLSYTTLATGDETNFVVPTGIYRGNPQVQHDIANSQFTLELNSAVRTWNGSVTTNWDTTDTNWDEGDQKFFSGDDVVFTDNGVGAVNLVGSLAPLSITLQNTTGNNYSLEGAGALVGTTGISMTGGGDLTLGGTGVNTFTGAISVGSGVLTLGKQSALGANSGVTVASGARVNLNGQTPGALATGGYAWTIAGDGGDGAGGVGAITNSGGAVYGNSGIKSLTLSANAEIGGNSGRFDIGLHAGGSSYGTISGGGFTLTKVGSSELCLRAPASNITYVHESGTMWFEDYDAASGTNAITVNGTASLGTYGTRSIANDVSMASGTTLTNLGGGTGTWAGALTLAGALNINTGGNIVIDGSITGSGNITRTNGNTLVLQNTGASYSGRIINNAGTLRIESPSATGTYAGADAITMAAGTTLQGGTITAQASATVGTSTTGILQGGAVTYDAGTGNTLTIAGPVSGTGNIAKGNNTGIVVFNGNVSTDGSMTGDGGGFTIGSGLTLTNATNGVLRAQNSNTLTFGAAANVNVRRLQLGTGTINITPGATVTSGGLITSDGSGNVSTVNQTGGTFNMTGTDNSNGTGASFLMGHWGNSSASTYNLSGGVLNAAGAELSLGWDSANVNFNQSGGTANFLGIDLNDGRGNAAAYTLTGGRLNLGANGITTQGSKSVNLGGGTVGAFANWSSSQNMALTGTGGNVSFDTLDSVDGTTARAITLTGVLSGTGGLTKKGVGSLALSATNTFNGTAQVEGGTLYLNAGAAASATVKSVAGGSAQPGTISTAGTANASTLQLDGGAASFRVGTATDLFNVTGTFSVTSASTVRAIPGNAISGSFPQTFTVIDYTGSIGGLGFAGLSYSSANPHLTGTLVDDTVNTQVKVQISAADSVVWKGNVNGNWDVNTTANWVLGSDGTTPSNYFDYDVVTLNDTGIATPTITLVGTITPATLSVGNTTGTYTLQGSPISGSTSLTKTGAGGLTLLANNSYGGTTTINGGTLTVGNGGTSGTLGGSGAITLSTGASLVLNRSDAQTLGRVVTGGGTLISNGGNLTTSAGGNNCDIVVNSGTFVARGGGFSAAFDAGKLITVNSGATLDTAVHSMGSSVGGGGDVPNVTLNGGSWVLNGEQYMRTLNMTAGTTIKVGTLDGIRTLGGSVFTINAAGTSSTIGSPLNLVNSLSLVVNDGAATNDLVISGPISNGGAVTKSGAGTVLISGTNTSSGALTISAGTVQVGDGTTNGALGTGAITNNATLVLNRSDALSVPNTISGTGSLIHNGAGTVTLGGTNTYTGGTTVNAGVLAIDGDSLSDDGQLVISGTGKVDVTNNETVQKLFFGASEQAIGTYGATGSGATFIDDTRFSGTGIVTVTGAGYSSWITTFGLALGDQGASADPDGDGISNAVEWVLGGNPATGMDAAKLPTVSTSAGSLIFTFKRDQDSKVAGTTVAIEVGTSLASWPTVYNVGNDTAGSSAGVTVTDNLDGTDTISLSVTQAPDAAKFARLKVTVD